MYVIYTYVIYTYTYVVCHIYTNVRYTFVVKMYKNVIYIYIYGLFTLGTILERNKTKIYLLNEICIKKHNFVSCLTPM